MYFVKQFNINGVDTKQIACIELRGKPNAATEGAVGVLGIDVTSPLHEVYKCVAVNGSIYTWELLSNGLSVLAATISGGGEKTVRFPYTELKIPSGYVLKVGDLIIDSDCYLYQVSAIDVNSCSATYCDVAFTKGLPGDPGITPHIGENGNWWVGDTDMGVLADVSLNQVPWNVDENVGSIVVNPITKDDLPLIGDSANWEEKEVEYHENGTNIKRLVSTYGIEFPAINSGEVYLHFIFNPEGITTLTHDHTYTDHEYQDVYDEVLDDYVETLIDNRERTVEYVIFRVCVGGVPAKEYSRSFSDTFRVFEDVEDFLEEIFETVKTNPPLLSVSKGDTIRIEFEVCTTATKIINTVSLYNDADKGHIFFSSYTGKTANLYDPDDRIGFTDIYLSANIDTPYKYIALIDKKDTSMEEILNALLGV